MRTYDQVTITSGAVHVVAPRTGRLRLTEAPLDLSHGVDEFLAAHVLRGLHDAQATAATFVVHGNERASGLCDRILSSNAQFVARTASLARLLYAASDSDQRVSDGTLAVLRCEASGERFLGMLKLDPANGYRTVEDHDARGRLRVRFELEAGMLPSARERVQKAAFVRSVGRAEYDMLIVDRQRLGDTVSHFFVRDFLGAEVVFDATLRTKVLYRTLTNAKNEQAPNLKPAQLARLEQYIDGQVVSEHVNVAQLIDGLPVPVAVRATFKERIDEALPDRDFDLDPDVANKFVKNRRFSGDNSLNLSVPAEFYNDMVDARPPGDDGRWTITVRTREWRER